MKYGIHVRSQHAKHSRRTRFHGPDAYVAVTMAPESANVPYVLNQHNLELRGIKIKYFGEGYREHQGPRSALGTAIKQATEFVKWHEYLDDCWSNGVE